MRKSIDIILILGFAAADWLRFHDILKPETPTAADWLILGLSLIVFWVAFQSLLSESKARSRAAVQAD